MYGLSNSSHLQNHVGLCSNGNGIYNFLFNRVPGFFNEKELNLKKHRVAERGSLKRYHEARKNYVLSTNRQPLSDIAVNNNFCRIDIDIDALRKRQVNAKRARDDVGSRLKSLLENRPLNNSEELIKGDTVMPSSKENVIPSIKRKLAVIEAYKERQREELFHLRRQSDEAKKLANRSHSMKRKLERVKKLIDVHMMPCKQICWDSEAATMTHKNEIDVQEEAWHESFLARLYNPC